MITVCNSRSYLNHFDLVLDHLHVRWGAVARRHNLLSRDLCPYHCWGKQCGWFTLTDILKKWMQDSCRMCPFCSWGGKLKPAWNIKLCVKSVAELLMQSHVLIDVTLYHFMSESKPGAARGQLVPDRKKARPSLIKRNNALIEFVHSFDEHIRLFLIYFVLWKMISKITTQLNKDVYLRKWVGNLEAVALSHL